MIRHPPIAAKQKEWLARAYPFAQRDHDFWLSSMHQAGKTGLARYFDIGEGPVPDIADHSSYYIDVIEWLVAHPEVHTNYLIAAPRTPVACGASGAGQDQLRCDPFHRLRARLVPWLSAYPRLLQGRPRGARVGLRYL